MKKLITVEACFKSIGLDYGKCNPDLSCYPENYRSAMKAQLDTMVVVDALNRSENDGKEWFPNWDDRSERKHEIWWDMEGSSSGGGFSYDVCDFWLTYSVVGSRLCLKSPAICKHIDKHFVELFKTVYVK